MTALFDPGLQPERTELAWRRTALALGLGSLVALRLLPHALGSPAWVWFGVTGLVVSGILWVAARRRYRAATRMLAEHGERAPLSGGGFLAVLAALVVAGGLAALVAVAAAAADVVR